MVRESSFYQHMTVEASHLRNCKDTDTTKGSGRNIKDFSLCNVGNKLAVGVAFGHYGKAIYEVFKFLGVKSIGFNQPKGMLYKSENPFA